MEKLWKTQSPLFRPISCLFLAPLPVSLATTPFFLPLSPPILSSSASIYARNQFYKWPAGKAGGRRGIFRAESERESEREIEREINLCNLEFSEGGGVGKSTSMCSQ